MNWKKLLPTLIPLAGTLLTALAPELQRLVAHLFQRLAAHPDAAAICGTVIVAAYHALPSPLQK